MFKMVILTITICRHRGFYSSWRNEKNDLVVMASLYQTTGAGIRKRRYRQRYRPIETLRLHHVTSFHPITTNRKVLALFHRVM
jgi:hypothetical protein